MLKPKYFLWYTLFVVSACSVQSPQKNHTNNLDPLNDTNNQEKYNNQVYQVIRPGSETSAAVRVLLIDARGAASSGNISRAESLLERALRIEPRNAVLWHYMAKMKLHQSHYSKAIGLAAKSTTMSKDNNLLKADNWRIIAHAQNWLGQIVKSQQAQQKADQLSGQ